MYSPLYPYVLGDGCGDSPLRVIRTSLTGGANRHTQFTYPRVGVGVGWGGLYNLGSLLIHVYICKHIHI